MGEINNHNIILKQELNQKDYKDIKSLQGLCLESAQTTLKLELEFKLSTIARKSDILNEINEFMYYDDNLLIGYIGIGNYGGDVLEVNGMVHPNFRRQGIFTRLFSLVKDEWNRRESQMMLLLSDNNSKSGLGFIESTSAKYDFSEYEMFLNTNAVKIGLSNNINIRAANNNDTKEIARQDAIYFGKEYKDEGDITIPGVYLAEVENIIIGKVRLEVIDGVGGIYGVGVLPECRGKGYGRDILNWSIEKLREKNAKSIRLQVVVINNNALNLYKSCGFEETSTMDYYKISKN